MELFFFFFSPLNIFPWSHSFPFCPPNVLFLTHLNNNNNNSNARLKSVAAEAYTHTIHLTSATSPSSQFSVANTGGLGRTCGASVKVGQEVQQPSHSCHK